MLEEIWKNYYDCANQYIPNWKTINKNDLCNKYVLEANHLYKQGYLSAIICKYWPSLLGYINKCYLNIQPDVLYDAFIDGILYSLNNKAWLNEDSSVYNNPNGPDICINRKVKFMIWNAEGAAQKSKRDINNHVVCSTDDEEVFSIGKFSDDLTKLEIHDLIFNKIYKSDYVSAMIIHYLIYGDVFVDGNLDKKRLCKRLRNFDEIEKNQILNMYKISNLQADDILFTLNNLSSRRLYNRIDLFLKKGLQNVN